MDKVQSMAMLGLRVLVLCAALTAASARDLSLKLTKVSQVTSPMAKCIDGTAPAYYWRDGVADGAKSAILFLEGGGWCYPSEVLQASGANCAFRAKSALGSSASYTPSVASMGYEGGTGFTSGNPNVTKWANWATAYVKYGQEERGVGERERGNEREAKRERQRERVRERESDRESVIERE
jgi:hypothetical protein